MVVGAHAVLGAVAAAAAATHHGVAAQGVGKGQLTAGVDIAAVVHAGSQRARRALDALAAHHVAHEVVVVGDVALHVVEKRIEALERREARRHGKHELGVHNGQHGHKARVAQTQLLVGLLVRDDGAGVHLRSRARRGGHAHQRQRVALDRQALGGAAHHKIPDVAGRGHAVCAHGHVGGCGADALAPVHDRAAAQRHHKVAALVKGQAGTRIDRLAQRVGLNTVEQHVAHARAVKLGLDTGQVAVGLHRLAAGSNNKRAATGQLLVAQLGQLAGAKQNPGLRKERVRVAHESSPICRGPKKNTAGGWREDQEVSISWNPACASGTPRNL